MSESKTPAQFRKGDLVDFTVRGARVDGVADDLNLLALNLTPDAPEGSVQALDLPLAENVEVTHAAPAEWPPLAGDKWHDRDGDVWFGVELQDEGGPRVDLVAAVARKSRSARDGVEVAPEKYGPLTLVHREAEQGGGRS